MIDDQKTNRSPSNTNRTCRTFGSARETADQDAPRLLYSRHEAARQLSISVRSLDYLIANKELATRRIGKKVLVPHGELVRYAKGHARVLRLNSIAVGALEALHPEGAKRNDFVFPSARTGESLQGSRGWFPAAVEKAGLVDFTWHCLRHTTGSRLVMAGVDLRTVAEILGHRTLQMVMRYSHLAPEHQMDAVDRLVAVPQNQTATRTATSGFQGDGALERTL